MAEPVKAAEMRWSGHYCCCFGDEEAVGSNPATPTLKPQAKGCVRSKRAGLG